MAGMAVAVRYRTLGAVREATRYSAANVVAAFTRAAHAGPI